MKITCFVINLRNNPERWIRMKEQLALQGFMNPIRIDAVIGEDVLKDGELPFSAQIIRYLTPGEVGCLLSHKKAWEMATEAPTEFSLIMEDDVSVSKVFNAFLSEIELDQNDVDVLRLEPTYKGKNFLVDSDAKQFSGAKIRIYKLISIAMGTAGYIISKRGAEKLLRLSNNCIMPVDELIYNKYSPIFWAINKYQVEQPLVCQVRCICDNLPRFMESSVQQGNYRHPGMISQSFLRIKKLLLKINYLNNLRKIKKRKFVSQNMQEFNRRRVFENC